MPKHTDNPRKMRNVRFTDEEWEALRAYANMCGTNRTGVITRWVHTLIPPSCWHEGEPVDGLVRMFDEDGNEVQQVYRRGYGWRDVGENE